MISSQSDQDVSIVGQSFARTSESLEFQDAWTSARGDAPCPSRQAIGLKSFARFAPLMAVIEVDVRSRSLPFRLCGSGFFDLLGFDLTGRDYLDLVDPAIKENAFDSVVACLDTPCGLWQSTPTQVDGGDTLHFELTIFPISKTGTGPDHILVFVTREKRRDAAVPTIERVHHSTVWQWIDLGFGLPEIEV